MVIDKKKRKLKVSVRLCNTILNRSENSDMQKAQL